MIDELNSNSDDKNLLQNWMSINGVGCNFTKTKFVVFEKRSSNHSNLDIGGNEISSCESYKYLGLYFDKKTTSKYTLPTSFKNWHDTVAYFIN